MAIMRKRTMYLEHLRLVPSFQYLQVLQYQHRAHLFLYDTMLEYDAPTIIDVKYTNHGYFPSNVNKFVQIVQEQSLLYPLSFAILQLHQQVAAFLQTIGSRDMILQQLRFVPNDRLGEVFLRFETRRPALLSHRLFVFYIQNDRVLGSLQHFRSWFHLHS